MPDLIAIGQMEAAGDVTTAANIRESVSHSRAAVSEVVGATVPQHVADALNTDVGLRATVELAVQDAAEELDFVLSDDSRLPHHSPVEDEILAAVISQSGERTWLEARASDGGLTDHAAELVGGRVGARMYPVPGYLAALTDAGGRLTDLAIRASDGQFADFVVERLAARMAGVSPGGSRVADVPYVPGANVVPLRGRVDALAAWGSSTIAGLHTRLSSLATSNDMTWYAGGQGGERVEHHAARMGAIPALLTFPGDTIPSSGAVAVDVSNVAAMSQMKTFAGHVSDVEGTLEVVGAGFVFTRSTPGSDVPCPPDTPFIPTDGVEHRADTLIINAGKNNLTSVSPTVNDPVEVARKTLAMVDHHAALGKRVLVLGQFVNTGTPEVSAERDRITQADAILARELGPMFLDVAEWVTSGQLWTDTGLTPTPADLSEQALGNKPDSVSADEGHFNSAGYDALLTRIEARLTDLHWLP